MLRFSQNDSTCDGGDVRNAAAAQPSLSRHVGEGSGWRFIARLSTLLGVVLALSAFTHAFGAVLDQPSPPPVCAFSSADPVPSVNPAARAISSSPTITHAGPPIRPNLIDPQSPVAASASRLLPASQPLPPLPILQTCTPIDAAATNELTLPPPATPASRTMTPLAWLGIAGLLCLGMIVGFTGR